MRVVKARIATYQLGFASVVLLSERIIIRSWTKSNSDVGFDIHDDVADE